MSVLLVGMSHRSAPVSMLEQVAVTDANRPQTLQQLISDDAIDEAMLVSTCNRVEYYVQVRGFHAGLSAVIREIVVRTGLDLDDLTPHLYVRYAQATAEHIFSVSSGLDSMVVGEQQIIGQIRAAYGEADELGTVGPNLHDLAQRALHTGKRVHSETRIDDAGASMVSVAVDTAISWINPSYIPGDSDGLAGRRALVLGAGAMSSLAATHLGRVGVEHITVANRTVDRAENLAAHSIEAGTAACGIALDAFPEYLADVDIVVTATGAMLPVVGADDLRDKGPLAVVDLSMPRDVEEGVADLEGIALFDIEHLQLHSDLSLGRDDEAAAQAIVDAELAEYLSAQRALEVAPTVRALRERAANVVSAELMRLESKTPGLTDKEREEVSRTVRRVVDKLLHEPTVQVKKLTGQADGANYAVALQRLFDLPLTTPEGIHADTDFPSDLMVGDRVGRIAELVQKNVPHMAGEIRD